MTTYRQNMIVRRSARLLNAVLQLHKQGFQNLVIQTYVNSSGTAWRCELHSFSNVALGADGFMVVIDSSACEEAIHSSAETGNEYFSWTDAHSCNAFELAELIKTRFPLLIEQAHGENYEYSGWLCRVVGAAEAGQLPIMFSDHSSGNCTAGPIDQIVKIGGVASVFRKGPHLQLDSDWHTAYVRIIETWRSAKIRVLPIAPKPEDDLLEHGAFWEGAIWYIQCVLGYSQIDRFMEALPHSSTAETNEMWSTFIAVWDADRQLIHLVAFLKRHALQQRDYSETIKEAYREDLRAYELLHPDPGHHIPHPYYGGENPLHLGGILHSLSDKLI